VSVSWYGATIYVEVAFDDSPLTAVADCTWTDITAYVRRVSTNRGRSSELSTIGPGTATIMLDNLARTFDPLCTSGAHYGKLLPMRRIRVRATVGVVTATLFSGYVTGWPQTYPGIVDSVVAVQCVDAFRVLELAELPGSAYEREVIADSPDYYWTMQTIDGTGIVRAAAGDQDLTESVWPNGRYEAVTKTLPIGGEQAGMDGGGRFSPTTNPAAVEFWAFDPDSSGAGVQGISVVVYPSATQRLFIVVYRSSLYVSYSDTSANKRNVATSGSFTVVPWPASSDAVHVAVVATPSLITIYRNGVSFATVATETGTLASPSYPYGATDIYPGTESAVSAISHLAIYSTAPSAARIQEHYFAGLYAYGHPYGEKAGTRIGRILDAIGWPSADRDLSTGVTTLGEWTPDSGSALAAIRSIEEAEQGLFYISGDGKATFRDRQWTWTNTNATTAQVTLGDQTGETRYSDISVDGNDLDFIRNVVAVTYPNGTVQAKDATSVTAYGPQSDSVDGSALPATDGYIARQLAAYRLRARKDPATRVPRVAVDMRGGDGLAANGPAVIDLDLGYRANVKRRPNGATDPYDVNCAIQGIGHTITPDTWEAELSLSPAPKSATEGNYFIMGDATRGILGAAAGNVLPY